jgi:hypothetical protein
LNCCHTVAILLLHCCHNVVILTPPTPQVLAWGADSFGEGHLDAEEQKELGTYSPPSSPLFLFNPLLYKTPTLPLPLPSLPLQSSSLSPTAASRFVRLLQLLTPNDPWRTRELLMLAELLGIGVLR